ncbi:VOC family protein [Epilithonimonas xixisoli]|uniref:Glyoxalase/bleomycin resistance protein/dioxygenase superfamily protein n=1 Tax=Epilithonimonas xixisoli TaxID=1476462 RepID=A0A4V3H2C2_9FLAO|nr:VOC family protein [Epilithonimonas xixisoli]TDX82867.1 glyoxalase/bleomycin resistance protein/dioxygenase superfamily protein [Epilithonimonas xixisoli]
MKFNSLRPILWTDKFEETIEFYTVTLGFELSEKNDDWGWATVFRDNVELMFAKPNHQSVFIKPNFTGSFYINVQNVDKIWESLKSATQICYGLETFEWGMREFAIYDNNGFILQFGQEIRS